MRQRTHHFLRQPIIPDPLIPLTEWRALRMCLHYAKKPGCDGEQPHFVLSQVNLCSGQHLSGGTMKGGDYRFMITSHVCMMGLEMGGGAGKHITDQSGHTWQCGCATFDTT